MSIETNKNAVRAIEQGLKISADLYVYSCWHRSRAGMSVSSGDGHASGAFANPSWNPMLPIHAQGCKVLTKLCTTFTEGMLQGLESHRRKLEAEGKIKEKWGSPYG